MTSVPANRRGMFALMGAMAAFAVNDMLLKLTAQRYPLGEVITVRGLIASAAGRRVPGWPWPLLCAARGFQPLVLTRTALDGARDGAVHHRADAHADRRTLGHHPGLAADHHGAVGDLLQRGRRLAALDRDRRRLRRHAVRRQADAGLVRCLGAARHRCAFARVDRDIITRKSIAHSPRSSSRSRPRPVAVSARSWACGKTGGRWRSHVGDAGDRGSRSCAAGQFLIVIAFRGADISVVAPFRYTMLIWAGIGGFSCSAKCRIAGRFSDRALIVGSGVYALHREQVRRRTVAAAVPPGRARRLTARRWHRRSASGAPDTSGTSASEQDSIDAGRAIEAKVGNPAPRPASRKGRFQRGGPPSGRPEGMAKWVCFWV